MIGYPAYYGLPPYEPAKIILEGKFDYANMQNSNIDYLIEKET